VQLSAAFSLFLAKVSVALDPYPSARLKPSPKPYEFPRDSHEADINQIFIAHTNVRHERIKMYMSGKQHYVPSTKRVTNLGSWATLCDILQKLLHKQKKCYI
jgi:hypothetical protein